VDEVIEGLKALLADGHAAAVRSLALYAFEALGTALEQADDSNGELGGALDRVKDLHLAACRASRADAAALAQEVFELELADPWGVIALAEYAEVLGEAGLAVYRRLVEAEWAKVPALGPGANTPDRYGGRRYRLTGIMAQQARLSGDLEQQVAVTARDLSEPQACHAIAELYRQAGQAEVASGWAERGWAAFADHPGTGRLRDLLAHADHDRDEHDRAMTLVGCLRQGLSLGAPVRRSPAARRAGGGLARLARAGADGDPHPAEDAAAPARFAPGGNLPLGGRPGGRLARGPGRRLHPRSMAATGGAARDQPSCRRPGGLP